MPFPAPEEIIARGFIAGALLAALSTAALAQAPACRGYKVIQYCDKGNPTSNAGYCGNLASNPDYQFCLFNHQNPPECAPLMGDALKYSACLASHSPQVACAYLSANTAYQRCLNGDTIATPKRCGPVRVPCDDPDVLGAIGGLFRPPE